MKLGELKAIIQNYKNVSSVKLSKHLKKLNYNIPSSTLRRNLSKIKKLNELHEHYNSTDPSDDKALATIKKSKDELQKRVDHFFEINERKKFLPEILTKKSFGIITYKKLAFILNANPTVEHTDKENEKQRKLLGDFLADHFKLKTPDYDLIKKGIVKTPNTCSIKKKNTAFFKMLLSEETKKLMRLKLKRDYFYVCFFVRIGEHTDDRYKYHKFFKILPSEKLEENFLRLFKKLDSYGRYKGSLNKLKRTNKKAYNHMMNIVTELIRQAHKYC